MKGYLFIIVMILTGIFAFWFFLDLDYESPKYYSGGYYCKEILNGTQWINKENYQDRNNVDSYSYCDGRTIYCQKRYDAPESCVLLKQNLVGQNCYTISMGKYGSRIECEEVIG